MSGKEHDSHVNRLHIFVLDGQSLEQLIQEAAEVNEFVVEEVCGHRGCGASLEFFIRWVGYPDLTQDDDDSWVLLKDCKQNGKVQEYTKLHKLMKNKRGRYRK